MTDKDFVLSVYPNAYCDGQMHYNWMGTVRYGIFDGDVINDITKHLHERRAISMYWAKSENEAWTDVAKILRAEFLTKLENN